MEEGQQQDNGTDVALHNRRMSRESMDVFTAALSPEPRLPLRALDMASSELADLISAKNTCHPPAASLSPSKQLRVPPTIAEGHTPTELASTLPGQAGKSGSTVQASNQAALPLRKAIPGISSAVQADGVTVTDQVAGEQAELVSTKDRRRSRSPLKPVRPAPLPPKAINDAPANLEGSSRSPVKPKRPAPLPPTAIGEAAANVAGRSRSPVKPKRTAPLPPAAINKAPAKVAAVPSPPACVANQAGMAAGRSASGCPALPLVVIARMPGPPTRAGLPHRGGAARLLQRQLMEFMALSMCHTRSGDLSATDASVGAKLPAADPSMLQFLHSPPEIDAAHGAKSAVRLILSASLSIALFLGLNTVMSAVDLKSCRRRVHCLSPTTHLLLSPTCDKQEVSLRDK
jgi:hypothetical protein